jgi:hypothetical protein
MLARESRVGCALVTHATDEVRNESDERFLLRRNAAGKIAGSESKWPMSNGVASLFY